MMGSCCCKEKIKIINTFPKDKKFVSINQRSKIILSYDEQFEAPRFEMKFDGFDETTMRIWPDKLTHKEVIEKAHTYNFY